MWLVAIDDSDFIDEHSLEVLNIFFDIDTIFLVATIGNISKIGKPGIPKIFEDHRVKMTYIDSVQRRYLGALICQMMDVYAISPELE